MKSLLFVIILMTLTGCSNSYESCIEYWTDYVDKNYADLSADNKRAWLSSQIATNCKGVN